jgi:O-Antigen ligase
MTTITDRPGRHVGSQPSPSVAPLAGAPVPRRSVQRVAMITMTAAFVFQPILHPSGPLNSSPVDVLTVASIVTAAIWASAGHHRLRVPYVVPVALMVAAGAASGLHGSMPGLALVTLATDVLLLAWCVAVANVLSAPRVMRCALVAWSWSGIVLAAVVVCAWFGHVTALQGLQPAEGNRVLFTFGDPNYASAYWDVTIFVVYATRVPAARWMRIAGYLLLAGALALTESNGGVLALGVAIVFLLLVRSHRRRGWVGMVATALVIGSAAAIFVTAVPLASIRQWALGTGQPLLVNSIGRSAQSSSERGLLIVEMKQLFEQGDGLLGLGPASTKPVLAARLYPYSNEAHNDFLAALLERGPIGLLGLLLLAGLAAARAGPILRGNVAPQYAATVPVPVGLLAALLVMAVNSFYEEILHFRFLWALLGIVAILGADRKRR